jgi:heme A synthase
MSRIPPLPRLPIALLGLLTLACFGGPLGMWLVVRGGSSGEWPPDRAVEWVVVALVSGSAAALFLACITVGWWYPRLGRDKARPER